VFLHSSPFHRTKRVEKTPRQTKVTSMGIQRFFILFLLVSTTIFCSCTKVRVAKCTTDPSSFLSSYDSPEMDKVVIAHSQDLEQKHGFVLENAKTCFTEQGKIERVRLHYTSQEIVEMEEARDHLVEAVDGLLEKINQDPILRARLASYPFQPQNLEVHITYQSFYGRFIDPYKVAHAIQEKGVSFFYNAELDGRNSDYWGKRVEPYYKTRRFSRYYQMFAPQKEEEGLRLESFDDFLFHPEQEES
jgi:hypothetical protein